MTRLSWLLPGLVIAALPSPALHAQAAGSTISDDEHRKAFDYLLGDWEFTGERTSQGGRQKFRGYWTATRTPDNHALIDEYRVVDDAGKTIYITTTLRAFDPRDHKWRIASIERSGNLAEGRGWKDGYDMRIEQSFGGPVLRFRYYNIRQDSFSWVGSGPDGKGEYQEFQWIEARRVGGPKPGVLRVKMP
jgi:hypothetical protein